jgi:hypothetical protein
MSKKETNIKPLLPLFLFLLAIGFQLNAQEIKAVEGTVSYITGQNIYVKFNSTQGIENGDTLFSKQNEIFMPVLVVEHHSSISCLCKSIGENKFKVADKLIFIQKGVENKESSLFKTQDPK